MPPWKSICNKSPNNQETTAPMQTHSLQNLEQYSTGLNLALSHVESYDNCEIDNLIDVAFQEVLEQTKAKDYTTDTVESFTGLVARKKRTTKLKKKNSKKASKEVVSNADDGQGNINLAQDHVEQQQDLLIKETASDNNMINVKHVVSNNVSCTRFRFFSFYS